jgi:hypothetical protein
MYNSL